MPCPILPPLHCLSVRRVGEEMLVGQSAMGPILGVLGPHGVAKLFDPMEDLHQRGFLRFLVVLSSQACNVNWWSCSAWPWVGEGNAGTGVGMGDATVHLTWDTKLMSLVGVLGTGGFPPVLALGFFNIIFLQEWAKGELTSSGNSSLCWWAERCIFFFFKHSVSR